MVELLINHDIVIKRELYKKYKFDLLGALSEDSHLMHYPLIKILCFEFINYCTIADSTYYSQEAFDFNVFSQDKNLSVKLATLRDLRVSSQFLDESNLFFGNFFSDIDQNEKRRVTIDQDRLQVVLASIKKDHHDILVNDVEVPILSPIGTPQSSFQCVMRGPTRNFFAEMRADSVSEILAQI